MPTLPGHLLSLVFGQLSKQESKIRALADSYHSAIHMVVVNGVSYAYAPSPLCPQPAGAISVRVSILSHGPPQSVVVNLTG